MVTGCIQRKDQNKFYKTMMRLSRGNAAVYFKEVNFDKYADYIIFVVLLVGQEGGILHVRCTKAATSFDKARLFEIPDFETEQTKM